MKDKPLFQLIYVSRMTDDTLAGQERVVNEILASAYTNNAFSKVTGMLLVFEQYFIQLLEGAEASIDQVMRRIARDARHQDLEIIYRARIVQRLCPEWQMCMPGLSPTETAIHDRLRSASFAPAGITGIVALELFEVIAAAYRHVQLGAAPVAVCA